MIRLIEVLIFAAWNFGCVWFTVEYFILRKRMRGLDNPVLWLSRHDRREHARKLLRREDDEYIQHMIEQNMHIIEKGDR